MQAGTQPAMDPARPPKMHSQMQPGTTQMGMQEHPAASAPPQTLQVQTGMPPDIRPPMQPGTSSGVQPVVRVQPLRAMAEPLVDPWWPQTLQAQTGKQAGIQPAMNPAPGAQLAPQTHREQMGMQAGT